MKNYQQTPRQRRVAMTNTKAKLSLSRKSSNLPPNDFKIFRLLNEYFNTYIFRF